MQHIMVWAIKKISQLAGGSSFSAIIEKFCYTAGLRVAGTVFGAVMSIFVARLLGVDEFGKFSFALSIVMLLILPAKIGFDTAAMRLIPEYISTNQPALLRGFLQRAPQIILLAGFITMGISYVVLQTSWFAIGSYEQELTIAFALIPLLSLLHFYQYSLLGFGKAVVAQVPETIIRPLIVICVCSVYWLSGSPIGSSLMLLYLIGAVCIAMIFARWLVVQQMVPYRDAQPEVHTDRLLRLCIPLSLISCAHIILTQTDVVMLGFYLNERTVGYYAAALKLTALLLFFTYAINSILAPMISEHYHSEKMDELQKLVTFGTRLILIMTVPLAIIYWCFGETLLSIFGEDFKQGKTVLYILTFAQVSKVISGSVGFLLSMTGHERAMTVVIAGAAALNIVLNIVLIPQFGAPGAAASTAISAFAWNIGLIIYVYKKLKIYPLPF